MPKAVCPLAPRLPTFPVRASVRLMRVAFSVVAIFATSVFAAPSLADDSRPAASGSDEIIINATSADPFAPSGWVATAVEISGVTKGVKANYYIPYMSVGQSKPRIGQMCNLVWRWHDSFDWITASGSARGVRLVTKFSCAGGPSADLG